MQAPATRRPRPASRLLPASAPGPARLGAAVDVIVAHLRRRVLLQAWKQWEPKLTQGEMASRILERQRLRLLEQPSAHSPPAEHPRPQDTLPTAAGDDDNADDNDDDGGDDDDKDGPKEGSSPGMFPSHLDETGCVSTSAGSWMRGRTLLRSQGGRRGGGGGGGGEVVRCLSSPAATDRGNRQDRESRDHHGPRAPRAGAGDGDRDAWRSREKIRESTDRRRKTPTPTVQACFKEEREAFIRDLQVLHRQLEAKDRDRTRRDREHQVARSRAKAEARAAQERVGAIKRDADEAAAARALAEAKAEAAAEKLDLQTTTAESLRARLRHSERLHKEQMDLERRQQKAAAEEASTERRRQEGAALTARKALLDGRRDWAAEKDTLIAAVREAGHRAELAEGEATEAKAHAVLLEERLQQTLEREAALNEEVEAQTSSARDGERRVARAVADAARARAAAAAQEEAFLENVKGLEERASRAEVMYGGENASREDLQGQLMKAREAELATSSSAQRELSAMNLRVVSLGQDVSALSAENKALVQRAAEMEALAGSSDASMAEMGARLKEASIKNVRLVASAAQERELTEKQWRRREERWRLVALAAQSKQAVGEGGENSGNWEGEAGLAATLEEMDNLRETAARLACDKEKLLSELSQLTSAADGETVDERAQDEERRRDCVHSGIRGRSEEERGVGDGNRVRLASTARVGDERRGAETGGSGVGGADERLPVGILGGDGVEEKGEEEYQEEGGVWQERIRDGRKDAHGLRRARDETERRALVGRGDSGGGSTPGRRCHEEDVSFDDSQEADACCVEEGARRRREKEDDNGVTRGERREGMDAQDGGGEGRTLPDAEDEALLVPRGGPIPVPSMLKPHSLGARDRGGAGGKSIAAASLMSTSSGRLERDLRRREHDALLALLRNEDVIAASGQSVLARVRRKEQRLRAGSRLKGDLSGAATAAAGVGDDSSGGGHSSFCGDEEEEEGEVGSDTEKDHVGTSPLQTPLTPEAWRNVLAALERSLRLFRGNGRAGEEEEQRRPRRRRHTMTAGPAVSSTVNDGRRPGHRQASPSAAPRQGSLSPEPPRPRCRSSNRPIDRSGGGILDPAGGDEDRCDSSSCDSRPHPRSFGTSPRKAYGGRRCKRSQAEGAYASPGPLCPGGGGNQDYSRDRDCGEDLPGALASALRDLLSSTLGVSEEGLREASLPELVGALRCEWEVLLEGMAAMKKEVDLARHQVDTVAAAAAKGGDDNNTQDIPFTAAGGQHLPPQLLSGAQPGATPSATAAVGASASELWRAESAGKALHSARLEAALTEAEQRLAGVRVKAEAAAGEAEDKIAESERDRAEATARLVEALRELADERAEHAALLVSLKAELQVSTTLVSTSRAAAAAATSTAAEALAEAATLRGAIEDWAGKAEGLTTAADSWKRRAEAAEKRAGELEFAAEDDEGEREEGREEGRREAEQRVEALESALEKLAETGWAAEGLSKEQLEVTQEISMERDDLVEENEKCAARLDQLTAALQDQREEKSRLANQLLDRERGLEALRAQADIERVKVDRLQEEVGKAQGICREMADRLLELQATKEELRATRKRLADASRELKILRRSRDHSSDALDEARRLRERLGRAENVSAETSTRAAAAEALAEEESRRARHLEARVGALQRQLDEVPDDLLVAHAEKRVLRGALDEAGRQAADVEVSTAAELRRRDADIRTFAAAAALQQERCGERLREQALTIHQLTLQGFSADAQATLQAAAASPAVSERRAARARARTTMEEDSCGGDHDCPATSARVGRTQAAPVAVGGRVLPPPRRGHDDDEDVRRARRRNARSAPLGRARTDFDPQAVVSHDAPRDGGGLRNYGNDTSSSWDGGDGRGGWDGYSFDSEFPPQVSKAAKGEDDRGGRSAPGSWPSRGSDEGESGCLPRPGPGFRETAAGGGKAVSGGRVSKSASPPLPRGHPPRLFRREL